VRKDAKTGRTQLGVVARITINRRDYGITFVRGNDPAWLGDMVEIELDLATRPAGPPAAAGTSGN
jgi:polyisoprenoid-binding protein YceI